jgi:2-iminoacetate synthase
MELAKPGLIQKYCRTNAIITFKEYLVDYASPQAKESGETIISQLINETDNSATKRILKNRLKRIENGERDLYI